MSNMNRPSGTHTKSAKSTSSQMPGILQDPSIKGLSFDQMIQNRGIAFTHKRAVPCPNMGALDDNSHDPYCTICDNSGMIYYEEKSITGIFSGNSLDRLFEQQGMWETGTAVVTFPAEYSDGTQADFNEFDQLVIRDFEVRLWELIEYEPTSNSRQKLRYPITEVDYIASVESGVLTPYTEGTDFNITSGEIEWISGQEPTYDSANDRGTVIVVSYYALPVYTVVQTLRELRVTQELVGGVKTARRLPQEVLVKRDFLRRTGDTIE